MSVFGYEKRFTAYLLYMIDRSKQCMVASSLNTWLILSVHPSACPPEEARVGAVNVVCLCMLELIDPIEFPTVTAVDYCTEVKLHLSAQHHPL